MSILGYKRPLEKGIISFICWILDRKRHHEQVGIEYLCRSCHWHMPRIVTFTLEKRAISKLYIFRFGMTSRFQNYAQWNRIYCRLGEKSQSSPKKSPKSPNGGISPNLLDKACRASNSAWKIGITSIIRMTEFNAGSFQNSQKSSKKPHFQSV